MFFSPPHDPRQQHEKAFFRGSLETKIFSAVFWPWFFRADVPDGHDETLCNIPGWQGLNWKKAYYTRVRGLIFASWQRFFRRLFREREHGKRLFFVTGKARFLSVTWKKRRHGLRGERKSGCTAEKTAGTGKDGNGETRREKAIQHNVMLPFTSEKQNITRKPLCLPHNILNGENLKRYCRRKEAEQRWVRFHWFECVRIITLYNRSNTENQQQKKVDWVLTVRFKPALVPFSLGGHWRSKVFLHRIELLSFYNEKILNGISLIMWVLLGETWCTKNPLRWQNRNIIFFSLANKKLSMI